MSSLNYNQVSLHKASYEPDIPVNNATPCFRDPFELTPPQIEEIRGDSMEESKKAAEFSLKDFKVIDNIGSGSFGIVYIVEKDGKQYAMKELMKDQIIRDSQSLYFVMEHVPNGQLHQLMEQIQNNGQKGLPPTLAKFYSAELVCALEYIHSFSIAHRDLKPQNILIDEQFHLKIIDFGDSKEITEQDMIENQRISTSKISSGSFSKILLNKDQRDHHNHREGTFVGTPLYVAPEMLEFNQSGYFSDLWALGCIIYQLLTGVTPFQGKNHDEVFSNILERKIKFPPYMEREAVDLIDKLLAFNPEARIGYNNFIQLKQHPYFREIDFKKIKSREIPVPNLDIFGVTLQSSLITDDSDDSARRKFKSFFNKIENEDCCSGVVDYKRGVFEGEVKVRRKLFFYKRRYMIIQDNGIILLARKSGRMRCDMFIDGNTEITRLKAKRFQIKNQRFQEVIESPDTDEWMRKLIQIREQLANKPIRQSTFSKPR
ncbi:UNKNOWN [Stylonychia lemnae]|uniref:non-specific serine/threonine protein kinase n=1 Tax=Stylonychia lemnae TaxID=5949 RepID=A0A078A0D1_STYLE|nr:UNKNOWN [Stylonychia lemnae]|eukprot:CDW75605.1 UNKNOWN [Stylonychia lemnae]